MKCFRFYLLLCLCRSFYLAEEFTCSLYLAPSMIPGAGRGVIAGRNFSIDEVIEKYAVSLTIYDHNNSLGQTTLNNYVFDCEDTTYAMLLFGPGSLYNSIPVNYNLNHFDSPSKCPSLEDGNQTECDSVPTDRKFPFTNTTSVAFYATTNISFGQEMFVDYGEGWFEQRGLSGDSNSSSSERNGAFPNESAKVNEIAVYSLEKLSKVGICLSQVAVNISLIDEAGKGLFAVKSFSSGDLVSISPAMLLPLYLVEESVNTSVLMNYVIAHSESPVAILPLGYPAIINHDYHANVAMRWFDWELHENPSLQNNRACDQDSAAAAAAGGEGCEGASQTTLQQLLKVSVSEILETDFAPLDLAFYATRDIEAGEEILLDYGTSWEDSWINWNGKERVQADFRHPIIAPEGLFPEHWLGNVAWEALGYEIYDEEESIAQQSDEL